MISAFYHNLKRNVKTKACSMHFRNIESEMSLEFDFQQNFVLCL